ncbi:MAG: HD domain-containing protein [Thermoproteota archaeon]
MIVRGFIIPKRGPNDEPIHAQIISDDDSKRFYEDYKQVIRNLIEEFVNEKGELLQDAKDINALLNFFVLFVRSALYKEIIPRIVPATSGQVHHYFLHQYLNITKKGQRLDLSPRLYFEWLRQNVKKYSRDEEELRSNIIKILDFPSDSRPGANTSSLLVHSLTVSGMACSMYLGSRDRGDGKERGLAILRLACLFHDLGKLCDWRNHEKVAAKDLRELFSNFVEDDAKKIIEEATALIPRDSLLNTPLADLRELYLKADVAASGIDRISEYFLKMLSDETKTWLLRKAQEYLKLPNIDETVFMNRCYNDWSFWEKQINLEDRIRLTEEFCKNAIRLDNPLFIISELSTKKYQDVNGVDIARFDIRGIQEIIKVNDLRTMAGGSLTVDFTTFVAIPLALIFIAELPAEAILYFGGGNVSVLLPSDIAHETMKKVSKVIWDKCKLKLVAASHAMLSSFAETNKAIETELTKRKLSEDEYVAWLDEADSYMLNIFDLCEVCGKMPPIQMLENKLYCDTCRNMHDIGDKFHFMYKLDRLKYEIYDMSKYLKYMIEYIAGSSKDDIKNARFSEYKNIAALRLDANLAGLFIGTSISITDAFERSVRIDYSLKKAYTKFLELVESIDKDTYDRLVLGTIYVGGDDAFLLTPSRIAPYLATFLINEFYLEMGGKLTLSCGIAVAKPKHPLIPLYEAAGYLLDEIAKKNIRQKVYELYTSPALNEKDKLRGAIAFYTIDGGFMTPENLEETLKRLYEIGVSKQYKKPYTVSELTQMGGEGSFLRLLQLISSALHGKTCNYSLDNLKGAIEKDLRRLLSDQDASDKVKDFITTIKRDINVELLGDRSIHLQLLFAKRQAERLEEKRTLISEILQTLEVSEGSLRFGVTDALLLAKVVLGE